MLCALAPGDEVLYDPRAYLRAPPSAGDVVVARDPRDPGKVMIKRVHGVTAAGIALRGDNPDASTDSRCFGPVQAAQLVGRVTSRFGGGLTGAPGSLGRKGAPWS